MQYSTISIRLGYNTICSSPILSLVLLASRHAYAGAPISIWQGISTNIHTLIIGIQLLGLTLYLLGSRNQPARSYAIVASILLIIWGFCISLSVCAWASWSLDYYEERLSPEIQDFYNIEYSVWILKGVLWIIAGLVILVHRAYKP